MASSDSLGPALGNEDGKMVAPGGGNEPQMVTCPACQGAGQVPQEEADEITQALAPAEAAEGPHDETAELAGGPQPGEEAPPEETAPPTSPVTGRSASDMEAIRNYKENRPAQLRHQPFNEGEVASQGKRARERMKQGGRLGGF